MQLNAKVELLILWTKTNSKGCPFKFFCKRKLLIMSMKIKITKIKNLSVKSKSETNLNVNIGQVIKEEFR